VEAGINTVLCTPHFSRRYPTDHEQARMLLRSLGSELGSAGLRMRLQLGAEIGPAAAVEASDLELRRRRLANGYLLVELAPDTPAGMVDAVMARLAGFGLKPVFAHPERCRAVRAHPHILDPARSSGALVQVVARSLAGSSGGETAGFAWRLLESGRVDVLASDAHRVRHVDQLKRALGAMSERLGANKVRELTEINPARLMVPIRKEGAA
jgi:protein-tyrosine phosphatase